MIDFDSITLNLDISIVILVIKPFTEYMFTKTNILSYYL
jgi:hypothetical protein